MLSLGYRPTLLIDPEAQFDLRSLLFISFSRPLAQPVRAMFLKRQAYICQSAFDSWLAFRWRSRIKKLSFVLSFASQKQQEHKYQPIFSLRVLTYQGRQMQRSDDHRLQTTWDQMYLLEKSRQRR